ncbi:hypothetical protein RHGRI_009373 [Rhododendron griersonianum]|uniref:Amino acid transporter transmembrane domain-containing protein n=1 Tax=Rhododendron griersonianum TaxID=479676 RepID=A0AAV6KF60_9ERIC|nr:hypothetical protein RHGRI_009373 [Rhododendron griersonianum]
MGSTGEGEHDQHSPSTMNFGDHAAEHPFERTENGEIKGSIGGVTNESTVDKVVVYDYVELHVNYTVGISEKVMLLDTLKSPPPENKTMKKASASAIFVTTFFYLCCGCFGYAAFGSETPGNLLSGFGFYGPYWLVDLLMLALF